MSKRRTIVPKKEVKCWTVFEGHIISVGHSTRKQARAAAKKLAKERPSRMQDYKYVGRCSHDYRYIILDTH